ncbi:hypothetical protein COLO4_24912 [Corchorus olitorius]|uniref:Uncharacterized protein n=1 Tax=Corchorus olitorius TaxID=93759 RepID=A0A1R3I5X0_9ROSI|nr:hypothetical protein COLO4_24912 [Corchorus olitorius]
MEHGFSIQRYKLETSSLRCKGQSLGSLQLQAGSRVGGAGLESGSGARSGRRGAFRDYVDNMILRGRTVARALFAPEAVREVRFDFEGKSVESNECGVEALPKREGKEHVRPEVGPGLMGTAGNAIGPFLVGQGPDNRASGQVNGLPHLEGNNGLSTKDRNGATFSRPFRKWKKTTRVLGKYAFDFLASQTNLKDGRKRGLGPRLLDSNGVGTFKRSRDAEKIRDARNMEGIGDNTGYRGNYASCCI